MVTTAIIATILSTIFEIYINHMFFSKFGKSKLSYNIYYIFFIFLSIVSILSSFTLIESGLVFVSYSICVILHSLVFDIKMLKKSLLCFCIIITAALSEMIATMGITIGMNIDIHTLQKNKLTYIICLIVSKFLTYSILKPIKNNLNATNERAPLWFRVCTSTLPITSIFIIILLYRYSFIVNDETFQLATIIASFLLMLSNLLILFVIDKQEELYITKKHLLFAELHLKDQIQHYHQLYSQQEMLKKFRHDSQNFYTSLISILETLTPMDAVEYIKNKMDINIKNFDTVNSGNPVIDAIIHSKLETCKKEQITIEYLIKITTDIVIDQLELGVLIGNALDNAIESTIKCESSSKTISLKIFSFGDMISIEVINPTHDTIDLNNLQTTKKNKSEHGYGLKGIESITKKYNGNLSISNKDNFFILSAILVNKRYLM